MSQTVKQVDLMRQLVIKHGRKPETVCALYSRAERDGIVQRKSNKHAISPEQYAERLYRDGERKGWL